MRVQSLVWSTGSLPVVVPGEGGGHKETGSGDEFEAASAAVRPGGAVRHALMRLLPRPRRQASALRSPETAGSFAPEGAVGTAAPDRAAALGSASAVSEAQAATALAMPKTSR